MRYIYQQENWTNFTWDKTKIELAFGEVRHLQGKIAGQMQSFGFETKKESALMALTMDVLKSSEIEGEKFNYEQVRSSIAKRLGINTAGLIPTDRHVEGVVDMLLDATQNYANSITDNRLFGWHTALFPTGKSGNHTIEVGMYRTGVMQIVSGAMGKEKVHFEAIEPLKIQEEMTVFLEWLNADTHTDMVLKAAIAHFWFIIIHPFDDGNGRIARAISDLLLARADGYAERYYSMSSQIMVERKKYYAVLQKTQHSTGDITEWLEWFLNCLKGALLETENTLKKLMQKTLFWQVHEHIAINERQRLLLNKCLSGLEGKLKTSKYGKIAKCSTDTALRDIKDLISKGILKTEADGGRSTNYVLVEF